MAPFWDIIVKLRHSYNANDLESTIKLALGKNASSKSFLVKMEIMKLSQVTSHAIDLRECFKNQCKPVEVGGITHFIDEESEKLLRMEFEQYGNKLTNGVVEFVLADAKKRSKDSALPKVDIPNAIPLSFTKFFKRKEERIYFTKKVKLFYEDPESLSEKERTSIGIDGVTTNLSNTGISIRFNKSQLKKISGDIFIHMHEIEKEYLFSEKLFLQYRIVNTAEKNDHIYLLLESVSNEESKSFIEFKKFADTFLRGQRGKYKISVENTEEAVNVKMNEQFVMTRLDSLPLFFSKIDECWHVKAQLNTENNSHVGRIGKRENNKDFVSSIAKLPYIQDLLEEDKPFSEFIFVFPIKLTSKNVIFVSVPAHDFYEKQEFINQAIIAHDKSLLKAYRIEGSILNPEEEHFVPTSLPDNAVNKLLCKNREPAGITKEFAKSLSRMLNVVDVTDTIDSLQLLHGIKKNTNTKIGTEEAKPYALMIPKNPPKIHESRLESNDFRIEDRFKHKLNLRVRSKGTSANSEIAGETDNISSRGLKITLNAESDLEVGDEIIISIPNLRTSSNVSFRNQPYNIVGKISSTEYRLCISGNPREHFGRKIMQKYIYENIEHMIYMDTDKELYGLSRILRNLFTSNVHSNYGVIARTSSTRYIRNIIASEKSGYMRINPYLSSEEGLVNLLKDESVRNSIIRKSSVINKTNPYETFHILVLTRKKKTGHIYYITKIIESLPKKQNLDVLFTSSSSLGDFKLVRVKVTKKGRVLNKYYADELYYLSRFSSAKANRIEKDIRDTTGIIEISDVTYLTNCKKN